MKKIMIKGQTIYNQSKICNIHVEKIHMRSMRNEYKTESMRKIYKA